MGFNLKDRSASVEELILGFPLVQQLIMKRLRLLIRECLPEAKEEISGGVPFYRHHRMVCFIWPPSLSLRRNKKTATKEKPGRVGLGFFQGYRMANEAGAMLAEGRKQIYYLYFQSVSEINDQQLRALLYEADMLDQVAKTKRRKT